ncbi:hypothetical protein AYO40_04145 [Planctomycetaceae bacterium SCGC AG-212-D15]|nr:hypothetical protein AYO40_04145 [Planctomycetaceae bacterium SCGC AG-212-D15]
MNEVAMSAVPKPRVDRHHEPWVEDPQRLVLHDVSWPTYLTIADALGDRNLRLTYDRGNLEFMTLSPEHELYKSIFNMFIRVLAAEYRMMMKNLGSTTFRRQDLARGLEPDECYYFQQWLKIKGKKRLDLTRDPPPELVVEIDVTRSAIDRLEIYARLGVGEVWRFTGKEIIVYRLSTQGEYDRSATSGHFPQVPMEHLLDFTRRADSVDDITLEQEFREWVQGLPSAAKPARKSKRRNG